MSITPLWIGGEDTSFPNGNTPAVALTVNHFRAGYGRCAVTPGAGSANILKGVTFTPVTSCWLSARIYAGSWNNAVSAYPAFGLAKSGTNSGLFIGGATVTPNKITLIKRDAGVNTLLAAESGATVVAGVPTHRLDFQLVNYGASATVNVFWDSILLITYSGSVAASGVTDLDQVWITGNSALSIEVSEVFITDLDSRACLGVVTGALTGAGATASWTNNTFTNINGTTLSDTNPASSNTNNQVQSYNVTDLPAGPIFSVVGVKQEIRAAVSAAPAVTQIQMGWNNGAGSSAAGTGATKTVATTYATYEQLDLINPMTGVAWAQADINALQLELTAKT